MRGQRLGHQQQPGHAGRVVANSRPIDGRTIAPRGKVSIGREDGVQMSREHHRRSPGGRARRAAIDVIQLVAAHVFQPNGVELLLHVRRASLFGKGRRGNLLNGDDLGQNVFQSFAEAGHGRPNAALAREIGDRFHWGRNDSKMGSMRPGMRPCKWTPVAVCFS